MTDTATYYAGLAASHFDIAESYAGHNDVLVREHVAQGLRAVVQMGECEYD